MFNKNTIKSDKSFIDDSPINKYLEILQKMFPANLYMNTFFYTMITTSMENYFEASKWSTTKRIPDSNMVFIPVNISGIHWGLVVVNIKNREIMMYDSIKPKIPDKTYIRNICIFLQTLTGTKKRNWKRYYASQDCPQQSNFYDCAIFTMLNSLYLSSDKMLEYKVPTNIRSVMNEQLNNGKIELLPLKILVRKEILCVYKVLDIDGNSSDIEYRIKKKFKYD